MVFQQQQRDLPRILQQMHAQQLPGGALPTLPMAMPHPGLAGGPSQLAALSNNNNNGGTPGTQQQLAMLTKQELMLHSRPEEVLKGPLSSNEDSRHVKHFIRSTRKMFNQLFLFRETQYHQVTNTVLERLSQLPT